MDIDQWIELLELSPSIKNYFNAQSMTHRESYDAYTHLEATPLSVSKRYLVELNAINIAYTGLALTMASIGNPMLGMVCAGLIAHNCLRGFMDLRYAGYNKIKHLSEQFEETGQLQKLDESVKRSYSSFLLRQ